ncbi:MAG: HK97 family phage prohead protease, partial [Nitrosopumilus sp.]
MNKLFATAYVKEINEEERTVVAWASQAIVDRTKEVIRGNAWDLKNYMKHPVIMLSHRYDQLWVGKALWLKKMKEGLLFKPQFASTSAANEAFSLVKETGIAAFSVGFIPKKWIDKKVSELKEDEVYLIKGSELKDDDTVRIYTKCELLEISLVSVPACPTALLCAYNEGRVKTKSLIEAVED